MSRECPTCGQECASERGMKIHHNQVHGESVVSNEELLKDLEAFAQELGEPPTAREMRTGGPHDRQVYIRRFGSWNKALEAVGLEPRLKRNPSEDGLITELQECANDLGRTPTREDVNGRGGWSARAYDSVFGSWTDALIAAGISPNRNVPDRVLLMELKELAGELGRTPRCVDMDDNGKYDSTTYKQRFGSWNTALERTGMEPNKVFGTISTECENCGEEISRIQSQYDRSTLKQFYCSPDCQIDHHRGENHALFGGERDNYYGPNWDQQRKKTLERDGLACQRCGLGEMDHYEKYGRQLGVHHVTPFNTFDSYGEANRLDNLITVCCSCHSKVEGLPIDAIRG